MQEKDALFFLNFLLPVCDPAKSNIEDDPRLPYYTSVANFTNLYALGKLEWNGSYGRKFAPSTPEEHVHLDGIVSRNKNDQLMDNWDINHTSNYDELIAETMGVRRVMNLKRALKLCLYFSEKKRTDVGYDPCQKYRLIWDVLTHNTLCCIKDGGLDLSLDETSWANGSYSDMNRRLKGKKINKGGQHTIVVDANKRYMIAWTPRHKLFKKGR